MSSWKRVSFLFSLAMPVKSAFPRAEQRGDADQDHVDERRHLYVVAERLEIHEQPDADQSEDEAERCADEAVADDIQGFEIVAGMDVLLLEPRLVLGDDVQVEIFDAHFMQIVRHVVCARERGREIVEAFHGLPRVRTDRPVSSNPVVVFFVFSVESSDPLVL